MDHGDPSEAVAFDWDKDVFAAVVAAYTVGDAVAVDVHQTVLAGWGNTHWPRCSSPSYEFAETYTLGRHSVPDAAAEVADAASLHVERT